MHRILALLRHGLASGQSAGSELLPEGAAYLRRLGAKLAAEGWRPAAILTSPYLRARASAAVLAGALGCDAVGVALDELVPEGDPDAALAAIGAAVPLASPLLVVAHLPLVGRLAQELVGEDPGFSPGTLVEIARNGDGTARLLRRIGPQDLAGV
jgi:phosphohistidine phosphatase